MTAASIASLIRARRAAVAGTDTLTLLENVCTVAYPALTGLAVDDLLERASGALPLARGRVARASRALVSRASASIRACSWALYADIASHIVGEQQAHGHGTSKISARVEMVRDVVGFFEKEVPAMAHNVLAVVGSLAMLFTYDVDAGFIAMAVLLPMFLVNAWYGGARFRLNRTINNQIEREVDDIASG